MGRGLTPLLAAVFTALTEEGRPSVVVVDSSTDRIAHWFAAVSYLLPPPPARQLSFATHLFRPTRSRLHLIGTVPEAPADSGPDDEDSYTVFGFTEGAFPRSSSRTPCAPAGTRRRRRRRLHQIRVDLDTGPHPWA
ncbi:hypothetical protein [Streptomyces sp. NBC_00996]|uniref:GAP1-M domain-containing protein n=1 Tax=Streptomyces sp. NBC_00996 TaxID=2903710 RepID=UPI00386FD678|nr:hypothetical protein OG390_05825 [Streptomyces sp. NBC_00996]